MRISKIDEDGIIFRDRNWKDIRLKDYHDQECCESHYADWSTLELNKEYVSANGKAKQLRFFDFPEELSELIVPVKDLGFFLKADDGSKILVNCYADNNGYYNTDLELKLEEIIYTSKGTLDISECQQWD